MSKRIKKRRKILRLGTPIGFSLFCVLILLLLAGAYIGISWAVEHAPTVVSAVKQAVQNEVTSINATEPPLSPEALKAESSVETGSLRFNTPSVGTPDTSTPTPAPTPIMTPEPTPYLSKPLAGKTVGLDPMNDGTGSYAEEAAFNLEFAMELKEFLEEREITVVLTRTDNTSPCSDEDRYNVLNAANCNVAIRLGCSELKTSTSGAYVRSSRKNKELGTTLSKAYRKATGLKSLSGKKNGYEELSDEVCKNTSCAVGVLYMANFKGTKDKARIYDPDFRESMIEGIYVGLMEYYGVKETEQP